MKIYPKIILNLISVLLLTITYGVHADEEFIEGGHYELLSETQPTQTGDKIEVLELFWYRCPHCSNLEPFVQEWVKTKPENVEFVVLPAVLSPRWEIHARMFYTMDALNLTEDLHVALFDAIHGQRKQINTLDQFVEWAEANGANGQDIRDTFDSFAVETKLNFARVMTRRYGINGVPAVIVDGRYRTSVSLAGSHEELFKVIHYLAKKMKL